MHSLHQVIENLIDEATAARAHFQVWWVLRNKALPEFFETMNDHHYVDYFHTACSGNYKLFLIATSKMFDAEPRAASFRKLKVLLEEEGHSRVCEDVESMLFPHNATVQALLTIRNRSTVHNECGITRAEVYENNEISPNAIRDLIEATTRAINNVCRQLQINGCVFDSNRVETATMEMLKTLSRGRA